ncbi:MAG: thiol oxidoreductase [Oligoflexia bacterium]|nr:thiol oxidoreductase [Oligoflexia bacterium]
MKKLLRSFFFLSLSLSAAILTAVSVFAQDVTRLGGDLTSYMPLFTALELPAPNIRSEEMFQYHLQGHTDFHGSFRGVLRDGKPILGPFFNHQACGACHVKDGRGPIEISRNSFGSAMLIKVALKGLNSDGSPRSIPGVGEQLQDHSLRFKTRYNISLAWKYLQGAYLDGTPYILRRPRLNYTIPDVDTSKVVSSLRMSPTVIGMGLLEAVPVETLEALSDPDDLDGDGISGEVSRVIDRATGLPAVGRFGFRASHPSVKQQSAAAFFNDMGMTNSIFGATESSLDVDPAVLERVTFYQQAASVPAAREQNDPDVQEGKNLFKLLNCQTCHVMTLRTGETEVQEVSNQEFHPFTDLLLHDMGAGLADKRREFTANGREWRTTPLWGLGLVRILLDHGSIGYMHDGRARTLEEAILWHGGEGARSRDGFKALNKTQREQLVRFLKSL